MIFRKIVITNLFSYYGTQEYDFTPVGPGSVVLVVGRNGFGKTSLLNAVKLLFLGAEDKTLRRVGFPPRLLSRWEFLTGNPRGWAGVRNRHAQEGDRCAVRIELGDSSGNRFVAERSWTGSKLDEALIVWEGDNDAVKDKAAEERLAHLLPPELAPYFFFDGEEIQYLAEASDDARADAMERLLSLSFVTGVEAQLAEIVKEWRHEALPGEVQAQIKSAELTHERATAEIQAAEHRAEEMARDIEDAQERAGKLQRRMEGLRAGGVVADGKRLEAEIKALESALETELTEFATTLALDAPLLANPGLVKVVTAALAETVDVRSKTANSVIEELKDSMVKRLFDDKPLPATPLTVEQRRVFEHKVIKILEFYAAPEGMKPLLDSFDFRQARELHQRFMGLEAALPTLRQERARRLKDFSARKARLARLHAERREVETGSSDRAEEYKRLEVDFATVNREIGDKENELTQQHRRIETKRAEAEQSAKALFELQRIHHAAQKSEQKLKIAKGLQETLNEFRKRSRAARRQDIENAVNRHFRRLMTGHRMIDRIAIDEDFVMRFHDVNGTEFGQLTVSHGMRQLAVTALLWALKEVSGRALPIIVDTFLARIDKENRENLIVHYIPHAAEQIILLATDAEISNDNFNLLSGHIGSIFNLRNSDGQSTNIDKLPHVDRLPERSYG